ncbi:protein of unknown function [Paraburkholderia dioscoreae]|uniref:Uncharacterized protein n=1 Tax=Paraburkholderia dioscoreae TaxID=2604047 RepID=A0A5Q4ZHN1_9BURK|nr:protein of unknown function [Paraburkholderia dioscoreae]
MPPSAALRRQKEFIACSLIESRARGRLRLAP